MPSTFFGLTIAGSGVSSYQTAINTTANNIANETTKGYSRQEALMSAAAALGDAGSPASDTTLGPTSGLNADGQHDHIWDTCVPTFIHFNIPIMVVSVIVSQFI